MIKNAKLNYQRALSNLEKISSEIHQQRQVSQLVLPDRVGGEGCESPDGENLTAIAKLADFDLKQNKVYGELSRLV